MSRLQAPPVLPGLQDPPVLPGRHVPPVLPGLQASPVLPGHLDPFNAASGPAVVPRLTSGWQQLTVFPPFLLSRINNILSFLLTYMIMIRISAILLASVIISRTVFSHHKKHHRRRVSSLSLAA